MAELYVLDSHAVLAYFHREPGALRVAEIVRLAASGDADVHMSVVNLGEVVYTIQMRESSERAAAALALIGQWEVELHSIDQDLALSAASVKAETRMGYLDCFVVALARRLNATIVTGDPDFKRVEGVVALEWLE